MVRGVYPIEKVLLNVCILEQSPHTGGAGLGRGRRLGRSDRGTEGGQGLASGASPTIAASTPDPSPSTSAPSPSTPHDQLARSCLMETKHSGQEELAGLE